MSGQCSANSEGTAESVAAGCNMRELPRIKKETRPDCCLADDGLAVFTWGRGEDGQLGLGDTSDQDEPTYVDALRGVGIRQIACGSGHTVVLTNDGEV
jgi:alpha-tubulin suppressor-like RCC1 family protein